MRRDVIHNWLLWEAQYINSSNFWTTWGNKERLGSIYAMQLKSVLMLQVLSLGRSSQQIHLSAMQSPLVLLLRELLYSLDLADR